jgi:hypothetical protein
MREQEASTTARTAGRSRPKTEWQKLDERIARNGVAVSTARAQVLNWVALLVQKYKY